MKILLSTKKGALEPLAAEALKRDLETLGYEVAHAHMGATYDIRDVRIEELPDERRYQVRIPSLWQRIFGGTL